MNTTIDQTVPSAPHDVDTLNSLLRGEMSAVETYEQAIGKFDDPEMRTRANVLTRIRDEHTKSVSVLRERVLAHGGKPSEGFGMWGAFATTVTGAAKLMGAKTALAALKQGEQHGIEQYEKAVQDTDVSTEAKFLIWNELLPRCHDHVSSLEQMIQQSKEGAGA